MRALIGSGRKGNDKMDAVSLSATVKFQKMHRRAMAASCVRVLLVAPFAPNGGGMGRMMAYLSEQDMDGRYSFEMIESRGRGPAILSIWTTLRAGWTVWRRARGGSPVLLHVNMAERGSVFRKGALLYLGRALGLPTVLHLHAAEIMAFYEGLGSLGRACVRGVFGSAGTCVVLGEGMAIWLQARLGVPACRIEVLRNGVPSPRLLPFAVPGTRSTLLFLGNLQARKGLGDLLVALSRAPCSAREFELVVAGGGDASPWRAQAHALGLAGRVTFTGWLERAEVTALLARACVLILPSYHEGLPLVLLEAASMGVACITTPAGSIGEVFRDEETALLVAAGDSVALGLAIARMIDEPALRARIGANALALYERSFSMEIFIRRLEAIYEEGRSSFLKKRSKKLLLVKAPG